MKWLIDISSITLSISVSFFFLFMECATSAETEGQLLSTLFRFTFVQFPAVFMIVVYNALDNLKTE